jgi:hypothetical protein
MDGEFRGTSISETLQRSLEPEFVKRSSFALTHKGRFDVWAPPLFWGPWVPVWRSFGATGRNQFRQIVRRSISFETVSDAPSSFSVEIKGGDQLVRAVGPGSATVTITGNHATMISIRCKSHSIGQHVIVST